ncbi:MAG TPA: hypothetical protein VLA72_18870 [Anaerolineales bacterium]|nr:hypothetical protein [Anaerolineales bacterium]
MYTDKGQVVELLLENGLRYARIACAANLIPSPGQYLLAGSTSQPDLLPVSLFSTQSTPKGFIACDPFLETWTPGTELALRGPLGRGFSLPHSAKRVTLVAFHDSPVRLHGLMRSALEQGSAVVLVCDATDYEVPDEVEVQPLAAMDDILDWADYTAIDVSRENLPELRKMFWMKNQVLVRGEAQVLVRTSMPCGGIADCGVCAVTLKSRWKLTCKDGPVFDWSEL